MDVAADVNVPSKKHQNDREINLEVANAVASRKSNKGGSISLDSASKLKCLLPDAEIRFVKSCFNIIKKEVVAYDIDV